MQYHIGEQGFMLLIELFLAPAVSHRVLCTQNITVTIA